MVDTKIIEDRASRTNFFDQFDDEDAPALSSNAGWVPTLRERLERNFEEGQRSSLLGTVADISNARLGSPEENALTRRLQDARARDYEQMAPSNTLLDRIAAGGGLLAGGATAPENFIAAPLRFLGIAEKFGGQALGRIVEKGVETGVANVALDTATQGARIADSRQEGFDPKQSATSAAIGFALGSGLHGLSEAHPTGPREAAPPADGASAAEPRAKADTPPASATAAQDGNYFDRFDEPGSPEATADIARTEAATAAIKAEAPAPSPTVITGADLRQRYSTNGEFDAEAASEGVAKQAADALAAGSKVQVSIDGRSVDVTSVSGGHLQTADGQELSTLPLVMTEDLSSPSLRIEPAPTAAADARPTVSSGGDKTSPVPSVLNRIREMGSPLDVVDRWRADPEATGSEIAGIIGDIRTAEKGLAAKYGVKVGDLEDAPLTKQERDFLYYGKEATSIDEWRDIQRQLEPVTNLDEAATEISAELRRLPETSDFDAMNGEQQLAAIRLQVLFGEVERLGGDLPTVIKKAGNTFGKRFADPDDAIFMAQDAAARLRALFGQGGAPTSRRVSPAQGALPSPEQIKPFTSDVSSALPERTDKPAGIFSFDASELRTDAKRFQFKSGGDSDGVTAALRGVEAWDPTKANQGIVWQAQDGALYIVDGHQRSGLARRIKAADAGAETRITGVLYREADGISAEDVTAIAAAKNIAEGAGDPVDAAKVLKLRPDLMDASMPLSNERIKMARDLANLSDDAFRMVTNEVVPFQYGAAVGRLLKDDGRRQRAAMDLLVKANPENLAEAESLVRQVREEGLTLSTNHDLFGDEQVASSLAIEKAKVAAAAQRTIRSDKKLFASLVRDADAIEGAGNRLATDVNAARATDASELIDQIDALSYRKGPIGDALNEAAKSVREGRAVAQASRNFIDDIRGSKELGDARGRPTGRNGSDAAAARPSGSTEEGIAARAAPATPGNGRAPGGIRSNAAEVPRLENIIDRLTEAAPDTTAFRKGRMTPSPGAKKLGQFSRHSGVVRASNTADLQTITHEIAHAYETDFGASLRALKKAFSAELEPLAYAGAKAGSELSEGFAEFFRHYVGNPAFAAKEAPGFYQAFDGYMAASHPDKAAILEEVRTAYRAWLDAPSGAAIRADIVSEKTKGFVGRASEEIKIHGFRNAAGLWLDKIYTMAIDRLHPIDMAVNDLLKIHERNTGQRMSLKAVDNPYKIQRLAVDASQAGMVDLMHGVVPYREIDPVGSSMFDALNLALGQRSFRHWDDEAVQEFAAYLVSRRALVEFDRFDRGEIPNPPGKFTRGDYELARQEFEAANPQWEASAQMLYEFQDNLLKKKHAAGFLTDQQLADFLAKPDYVPLQRDLRDFGEEVGVRTGSAIATPRGKGKAGIVQAFRGSDRSVINPLEVIMRDALETANLIARNETFRTLEKLAEMAGPGGGSIVERIPSHQMKATTVDVSDLVSAAAKEQGLDARDIQQLRDIVDGTLGEHVTGTLFRAGEINEKGEPIIYVWNAGRKQALRLADGEFGRMLHTTLTGMTTEQAGWLLQAAVLPSTALRAGITTHPGFLIANFIRDQATAWIIGGEKFRPFVTGLKGAVDEVAGRKSARLYSQAGGIAGGENVSALHNARVDRDLQALRKKGFLVQRLTSPEGLLKIIELSETGTRVGLFKAAYDRGIKEGLAPYEALVEGAYTARDYIDFGRNGSKMLAARRLVPFLNASIQGLDKSVRTLVTPIVKRLLKMPVSPAEERELGTAIKGWAKVVLGLGGISTAQAILYHDDPEYQNISPYLRATHWAFKNHNGTWIFVPKPFELAAIGNVIERAFEATYGKDPKAMANMAKGLGMIVLPPTEPTGINLVYELATNYDMFRGKSIVPQEMMGLEPALQARAWTSEFSKKVGRALNVSPLYIDHAIAGFGGSWGRQILDWSNYFRPNAATQGWEDTVITSRFIKEVSRGSTSVNRFWDLYSRNGGEFTRVANTYGAMKDNPTLGDAEQYLSGKSDNVVAFALLNENFKASEKRLSPIRRAGDVITTISKFESEMTNDRIEALSTDEPMALAPAVKAQVDNVLSRLSMMEAQNALQAVKEPGWAQKPVWDTAPVWKELEAASPAVFEEIKARFAKAKIYSESGVRKTWPEVQKRLLQDRGEAYLGDLVTDAIYD